MAENKIEYILELDISNWARGMDAAIRDLRGFEQALDRSGRAISNFENDLDAAAKLTKDFEDIDIKATVNDTELDAALDLKNDLDGNISFNIGVDDADLDTAKRKHEDLGANISTTININDSDLSDVERQLEDIRTLAAIDVVLTFGTGAAGKVAGVLTGPVGSIIEMDTAMQKLEGTTGRMIPQAEDLIIDLYTNAWGDSQTAIADVIIEASNLGIEMGELETAVRSAFFVSDVFGDDASTLEILRTMDTMVKNELAPDFQTAADILVTGLQNGANRGDDLLDTFNEYGTTFNKMGISGEEALGMINRGLEAGVDNSDRIADLVREFGIRIGELDNEEVNTALDKLKLKDQRQAFIDGTIDADEFFQAVHDALIGIEDPAERSVTAIALFGTLAEDFGTDAVLALTDMNDELDVVPGTAQKASDTINNNLGTALTTLVRTLKNEVTQAINDTFDIDDLIDRAKTAISTFFSELKSGEGVLGALEIALDAPGLTEKIESLQRGLTDFVLSLLQGLAGVIDAIDKIPGIDASSGGVRNLLSTLGGEQFKIDLMTADPEDLNEWSGAIQTALDRGVEHADIATGITNKVNELVASGDLQAAMSLANLGDSLLETLPQDVADKVAEIQNEIESRSRMGRETGEQEAELATILANAELEASELGPQIAQTLFTSFNDAIAAGDPESAASFAQFLGELGEDPTGSLMTQTEDLESRLDFVQRAVGTSVDEMDLDITDLEKNTTRTFDKMTSSIEGDVTTVTENMDTAGGSFETFNTVAGTALDNTQQDFTLFTDSIEQDSARIEYRLDQISIRMAELFGGGGLSEVQIPGMAGGAGGTTVNNNINQSNTFNNQNSAASVGSGQAAANAIRQP